MHIVEVASVDDRALESYRNLKDANRSRWGARFIAEGDKLVRRLLRSAHAVESVLVARSRVGELEGLTPRDVPVYVVDDAWIERIVGFNFHRGMLACGVRPPNVDRDTMLEKFAMPPSGEAAPRRSVVVVCAEVHDPENLGSVVRSSLVFGARCLWLGPKSADHFSRRVLRTSMGGVLRMEVYRSTDLAGDLRALRDRAVYSVWGAVADREVSAIDEPTAAERVAIVLGSEGHGLDTETLAACDRRVTIPMRPNVDSLNLAVAAGIALFALARSRD